MDTEYWINFFEENAERAGQTRPDFSAPCELVDGPAIRHLRRSLAIFQLGETGEGTALQRFCQRHYGTETSDYRRAVALFVGEEVRHAQYLAEAVEHLGGQLITSQWTALIFRHVRRLINLEFELQILMTAEIIGLGYYALLGEYVPDRGIRSLCNRLASDEVSHLRFHADFFKARFKNTRPIPTRLWRMQFRLVYQLVLSVAWWDHRKALRAFGINRKSFCKRSNRNYSRFLTEIFRNPSQRNPEAAGAAPEIQVR